jgi:hypothetical protein
MAMPPIV